MHKKLFNISGPINSSLCKLYIWKGWCFSEYVLRKFMVIAVRQKNVCWSLFPRTWTEYGDLRSKSSYSVRVWENMDRNTPNTDTFYAVLILIQVCPITQNENNTHIHNTHFTSSMIIHRILNEVCVRSNRLWSKC